MKKSIFTKMLALILSILTMISALPMMAYAEDFQKLLDLTSDDTSDVSLNKDTFEIIGMREESVKYFRLADGTYVAAQYDSPVHYLNEAEEWSDIDNSLSASGSEYSTNNARVKFAKKITGNETLFTLHDGNAKITMSLDGAQKKVEGEVTNTSDDVDATQLQKLMNLENLSSKIIYANILDGVDLEYVVESYNIKENIIVKEKHDSYTYTFTVKLNNLNIELMDNGSVVIFETDIKNPTYIIPAPIVFDNNGEYAGSTESHYTLTSEGNGSYKLSVTVSDEWMNDENRAYPVTIDPPIYVPTGTTVTDTYINSYSTSLAPSSYSYLYVGNTTQLYWKTSSLPVLPESAYITGATFALTMTSSQAYTSGKYFAAYQVVTDWDSTLTWTKFKDTTNPQGKYSGEFTDFAVTDYSASNPNTVYTFDVTEIVKNWYNGDANYGICVSDVPGFTTSNTQFSSNEATTASRPKLCITFKDMKGVENYWTYTSQTVGNAGTGSVNNATGTLSFAIPTLSTTDSLMPYTPTLVYNSAMAGLYNIYSNAEVPYTAYVAGKGFKWNMNETIVPRTYTDSSNTTVTYYVWSDSDGTEHYFLPTNTTDVYRDEDGLLLTLEVNSGSYTITDSSYTVRTFTQNTSDTSTIDAGGILESITDKSGNKVQFTYNEYGRISYISLVPYGSSSITHLKITHNSSGLVNRILNETTQEAVIFYYSTSYYSTTSLSPYNGGYLRKVERAHQTGSTSIDNWASYMETGSNSYITSDAISTYLYDSTGRLTEVRDELSGYEVNYNYSYGKVVTIKEYGGTSSLTTGQTINLTYEDGYTVVRNSGTDDRINNSDDVFSYYGFDEEGRTISIYSTDVSGTIIYGASNGEYVSDNENAKNNLSKSAQVGAVSPNYLLNGGFERYSYNSTLGKYVLSGSTSYWTTSGTVATSAINDWGESKYKAKLSVSSGTTSKMEQYVFLPKGEYTLSFDLNNFSAEDLTIVAKATSMSGSNIFTENVAYNEYYAAGQDVCISMNFTADSYTSGGEYFKITIQVTGGSGTASGEYINVDNVMLEKSIGVSSYDMVSFGSFEATSVNSSLSELYTPTDFWTIPSTASIVAVSDTPEFGDVLAIPGDIDEANTAYQTIYRATAEDYQAWANGDEFDMEQRVYSISGFAKGTQQVANASSSFRLRVEVQYYKGESEDPFIKTETFDFSEPYREWQFVSGIFVTNPEVDYEDGEYGLVEEIRVYCDYINHPGIAYFDNIKVAPADKNVTISAYYESGYTAFSKTGLYTEWYFYENDNTEPEMIRKITSDKSWTEYTYDSKHRVKTETSNKYTGVYSFYTDSLVSTGASIIPKAKTTYTYNGYGLVTKTSTVTLDTSLDELTIESSSTYNTTSGSRIFGSLSTQTDSLGKVTRYFYDTSKGYLLAVINPDNTGVAYSYDAIGNLISVLPATYSSSSYSEVTNSASVEYDYDACNRLSNITTDTTEYTFTYDAFGNTDTISVGNNELVDYTYNSYNGKLYTMEYGNGLKVKYVYDELDRVSEIWYTNSNGTYVKRYTYSYTADGNLAKFVDIPANKGYQYRYDGDGRLIGYVEYDTDTLVNLTGTIVGYNEENQKSSVFYSRDYTYSSSNVGRYSNSYYYSYDTSGNIDRVRMYLGEDNMTITPTYDALSRLDTKTVSLRGDSTVNVVNQYSFVSDSNSTSALVEQLITKVNGTTTNTYNYTYDNNGNITQITNASGVVQYKYTYDDLGQLIREDNRVTGRSYVYAYDKAGNITSKKQYAFTTGTLGTVQTTYNYAYNSTGGWGDLLTSFAGESITYDEIGNPTSIGSYIDLVWEGENLISYVNGDTGVEVTYKYNDEGIRINKTVVGVVHTYTFDGNTIVAEEFGNYLFVYLYDETGAPIGIQYRQKSDAAEVFSTYVFEKNIQGDIIAIYNESGTKIASYTYDAWGNFTLTYASGISATDRVAATNNPFTYRGYYFDSETDLYYLNSRYYNSNWGRFINADCIDTILATASHLTDKNLFAYCDNNPIMRIDDNGEFWGTITGAVFGAISGGIKAAIEGDNIWAGIGIGAATGALSGLAVDLSIATGGLIGVAIAAAGGAISGAVNNVATELANDRAPKLEEVVYDAVFNAATNVLSMGMGLDDTVITGAKTIKQAFQYTGQNFVKGTIANGAGKVSKYLGPKLRNLAQNTFSQFSESVVTGFSTTLLDKTFKRVFGLE